MDEKQQTTNTSEATQTGMTGQSPQDVNVKVYDRPERRSLPLWLLLLLGLIALALSWYAFQALR